MKCRAGWLTSWKQDCWEKYQQPQICRCEVAEMAESKEELKSLLMRVKEESEKAGLKLSILKTKIMASGSHHFMANRWGNNGNSDRLYFLGPQNHCRLWLQPWSWNTPAPWKKSNDQPRKHIKKQRHFFADKSPRRKLWFFQLFSRMDMRIGL